MAEQLILPVFPLEIVVFPGEKLNLHIFEARYKALIADMEARGGGFVILSYLHKKLQPIGSLVQVEKIARRYPDGKLDISVRGMHRLQLEEYIADYEDKLYSAGLFSAQEEEDNPEFALSVEIIELFTRLFETLGIREQVLLQPMPFRCFDIAHKVGLSVDQEYELLALGSEYDRQGYLLEHLRRILPVVTEMEKLKKIISLNGHFREMQPPSID